MKANSNPPFRFWSTSLIFALISAIASSTAFAQDEESNTPEDPKEISLETSDGVALGAVFYPGTKEKESIPVILLHRWDKDRREMIEMAATLQKDFGYACIVPDLRGHGASDKWANGDTIEQSRMRAAQIGATIEDIEACKNYLIKENNEGNLNIDMLTVIAEDYATILAMVWTLRDWSYAPLGSLKQGQDVKAVVLIDPTRNFKGVNGNDAYRDDMFTGRAGAAFPILIAHKRDKAREAKNIYENMLRGRRRLESQDKSIKLHRYELQSGKRTVRSRSKGDRGLDVIIGGFFEKEVFNRRHDFGWAERKSK